MVDVHNVVVVECIELIVLFDIDLGHILIYVVPRALRSLLQRCAYPRSYDIHLQLFPQGLEVTADC